MKTHAAQKNYYDILGISANAADEDIKQAYRRLVLYWHPDTRTHDRGLSEDHIKEINEAFANLSNRQLRARYDHILKLQRKAKLQNKRTTDPWTKFWSWLLMNESTKR